ncbi:hypothetical protein ACFU7T_17255 [Streptomyces sp. NPDC057555]|uniref:hypothetical protein n=1 Tax=Streptomyces sp. NPDC057555 TaxID=3346166 RepID=UPI0036A6E946
MDAAEDDQGNGHSDHLDRSGGDRSDRSDRPDRTDQPDRTGEFGGTGESVLDVDPGLDVDDEVQGEGTRMGLTPRQARRVRVALASVMMALMAVLLVVRLASRGSVLVVGVYGAALILCGTVIELSRHGRTRLGTWLLVLGLAAAIASDWLLLP